MKEDLRDRALGETLDREVRDLEPKVSPSEVRRRGSKRRALKLAAIATAVGLFAGGVGIAALQWADQKPSPAASPSPSASVTHGMTDEPRLGRRCTSDAAIDPFSRRSHPVLGDVEGDGHRTGVWTVDDPGRPERCSRFVVVFRGTQQEPLLARLPEWWMPQLPKIGTLANIDSVPGSEVVATFDAGGFSRQVAIFSVRDGRLVPLRIFEMLQVADAEREAANLDCAGPGEIVWSTTGSRGGPTTNVLRRFYRLHGTRFQLEFRKTERSHVPSSWIGTRKMRAVAPELARLDTIFPSCSATR